MKKEDYQAIFVLYLVWLMNLELNPGMGYIWFRPNESGKKKIVIMNVIRYMIEPFRNIDFWRPMMWDINMYTFIGIGYTFYKMVARIS